MRLAWKEPLDKERLLRVTFIGQNANFGTDTVGSEVEAMLLRVLPSSVPCNHRDSVTSVLRKSLGLVSPVRDLDLGEIPFCTFILSKRS